MKQAQNAPHNGLIKAGGAGRVFLVGAGPGDPGLITVRGQQLLGSADVVVYDRLAAPALLQTVRPDAELINVGKMPDNHPCPQHRINEIIVEQAQAGKSVVRLKGGDPYIFGRGGEEALACVKAGISFEVVPGITSAVAASAYAGIPVTHRDYAAKFALITGHEKPDAQGERIDWPALARWQGTLAFYMGVKNLPLICTRLIEHGMAGDTPAAIIQQGTTPAQRTVTGTLTNLPNLAQQQNIQPPAMIVVGPVVSLHPQLNWFEQLPLFGQRIVVTRARAQVSGLLQRLTQLGAEVLQFPTIRIEPPTDPAPLQQAVATVHEYDWVVFTSVNGVEAFFQALQAAGADARRLARARVCTIGPVTTERLLDFGIRADVVPDRFVAEAVVEALQSADRWPGRKVLLPRAEVARSELPDQLRALDAAVNEVTAYRTVLDHGDQAELRQRLQRNEVDWITFTSSSTVRNLLAQIDPQLLCSSRGRLASIGPITSATITEAGLAVAVEAAEYTIDGLITALRAAVSQ